MTELYILNILDGNFEVLIPEILASFARLILKAGNSKGRKSCFFLRLSMNRAHFCLQSILLMNLSD